MGVQNMSSTYSRAQKNPADFILALDEACGIFAFSEIVKYASQGRFAYKQVEEGWKNNVLDIKTFTV